CLFIAVWKRTQKSLSTNAWSLRRNSCMDTFASSPGSREVSKRKNSWGLNMPVKLAAGVAATALFLSVMPAFAHHAFSAEFDVNKPIRLEGTVAKMEWVNPHA